MSNTSFADAARRRLSQASSRLLRVDGDRTVVEEIEAASTDRYLAADVAVDVTLTTAESTLGGSLLAEAQLILIGGKVALLRTWKEGQDFVVHWLDLEPAVRDGVGHALPDLVDAVAATLLRRAQAIEARALERAAFRAEVAKVMAIRAERDGGSTDG